MKIHTYASQGDCTGVRNELGKGVPVDARDERDYTPLAYAASRSNADDEMLRLLIESGADVNAGVDSSKSFPIGLVACSGNTSNVQLLLNAGANIRYVSPKGLVILTDVIYSLSEDHLLVPVVEYLVQKGAEIDCENNSPLRMASYLERFDVVELLLDTGAKPSPLKWTQLMKAVVLGSCDDVRGLLDGAENLSERDSCDRTPWLLASIVGDIEKAKLLQSAGANTDDRGRGGDTALMYCAARGHSDLLKWLLEIGTDIEAVDDASNTALMLAAQEGMANCVELLLEAGADLIRKNEYDENAMSMASTEQTIRLLAGAGGDIGEISTEMKRMLTGLHGSEKLNVSKAEYLAGTRPRFGESNPEVMDIPFWKEMVRVGISAYQAKAQFGEADNRAEPAWCFSRFGTSFTEIPDGRFVQIGGEHEDYYDSNFCIYNDVIVHDRSGQFEIMGYPEDVFPPTDFHSATYFEGFIYIIGGLGYHGSRMFGTTPIYRLDCKTWKIETVHSVGENPGWIYNHRARLVDPGILVVSGGETCNENEGEEQHVKNEDEFYLDLMKMVWTRM